MASFWKPGTGIPLGVERGDEGALTIHRKSSYVAQREALPIYRHRKSLLFALEKYRCVIIVGETGCGKTTQVGGHLDDTLFLECLINDYSD